MDDYNVTHITEFILLAVTDRPQLKAVLFTVLLTFYLSNVFGNMSIMTVVIKNAQLHTPMYYLLANLSVMDMGFSTVAIPKMLANLLLEKKSISFKGCIMQLYFFHFFGVSEAFLLATMSYDRYVAICHPLRYIVMINQHVCSLLASCPWIIGFSQSLYQAILTSRLSFCASNEVRYFFCDVKPLFKLACGNTYFTQYLVTIVNGCIATSTFFLILISYIFIGTHILNIKSSQGRKKAFSTCASHIIIVVSFLGTAIITYARRPTGDSVEQDRMVSILFTAVTPSLNPFVYTLRNKEVKKALRKLFCGKKDSDKPDSL